MGIVSAKMYAFGVAAAIAALGGVVLSMRQANVQFGQYNVVGSVLLIQYAVVGGVAWVSGVVAAAAGAPTAIGATIFDHIVPDGTDIVSWLAIIAGVGAISVLRHAPDGIAALFHRALHRVTEPFQFPRPRVEPPVSVSRRRRAVGTLEISEVSVRFGGVVAVDALSFTVEPGEVVGLIGPNGAGKTTLLDVVTGFTTPSRGPSGSTASPSTGGPWSVGREPASSGPGRESSCSRR